MGLLSSLPQVYSQTQKGWPWTEETSPQEELSPQDFPKISIITPSFNQGTFIEETIRSVLLQNYPNLEYIIIDGGSSDNSVEIIQKYEPWITYWKSEPDRGQSDAINKGFKKATGSIINWLCSDDLLLPGALFTVGKSFCQNPDSYIVYGFTQTFSDDSEDLNFAHRKQHQNAELTFEEYLGNMITPQPSTFIRRKILEEIGYLDESLDYTMDYDLIIRIILNTDGKIVPVNKLISKYRLHSDSKTEKALDSFRLERMYLFCKLLESVPDTESELSIIKALGFYTKPETFYQISNPKITASVLKQALAQRLKSLAFHHYETLDIEMVLKISEAIKKLSQKVYSTHGVKEIHARSKLLGKIGIKALRKIMR